MVALFTLVLGYRNRDLLRVKRCLDSLKNQTEINFQVIFVDYGSDSQNAVDLVSIYPFCRYIYADSRGLPWNRAKALNIGIREAQTDFVITSDIDMIFPPDFFAAVKDFAQEDRVVNARCFWLDEHFEDWDRVFTYSHFPSSDDAGKGGFQLVAKKHLDAIRGFDEYYQYYGVEDRDINYRLKTLGLRQVWFEKMLYHQWHKVVAYYTYDLMPEGLWDRMNLHFIKEQETLIRNSTAWGWIPKREERQAYQFVNPDNQTVIFSERLHRWEKSPWNNQFNVEFLDFFNHLASGEAMLISNYYLVQPLAITARLLQILNRIINLYNKGVRVDYKVNRLRSLIALLTEQSDLVEDYYLFPDKSYVILVRK